MNRSISRSEIRDQVDQVDQVDKIINPAKLLAFEIYTRLGQQGLKFLDLDRLHVLIKNNLERNEQ